MSHQWQASAPTPSHHYVRLVASDVHTSESCVLIRDADGNVIQTIQLDPGDSEMVIEVPDGSYEIVAQSGVAGNSDGVEGDKYDNFSLAIFEQKKSEAEETDTTEEDHEAVAAASQSSAS